MMGFTRQDLEPHKHPEINQDYIRMLTRDDCLEEKVRSFIIILKPFCRVYKIYSSTKK